MNFASKLYFSVNEKNEAVEFLQDCYLLHSYLCEFLWGQQNKGKDLFEEILNDIFKYNPLC